MSKKSRKLLIFSLVLFLVVSGFLVMIYPPPESAFELTYSEIPATMNVGETLEITVTLKNKMLIPHYIICSSSGYLWVYVHKEGDDSVKFALDIKHAFIFSSDSLNRSIVFQPVEKGTYVVVFRTNFAKGFLSNDWRNYYERIETKIEVT